MRIVKSRYNQVYHISREEEEKFPDADAFYYQAIENAEGVPFQLIFGQKPGDGFYLNTGAGITQLLGISPGDLTEKLFYGMIEEIVPLSKELPADISELRRKFINGEIKSYKVELLVRTADGKKKWIRDSSLPLINEDTGKVIGAFGIFYDITDARLNPGRINRLRKNEDECDTLKAAFLHNISHEIRTPLNAIVGFSTLLGEAPDGPDRRQEYLDTISRNADHLLEIIDDIVEMSKIEAKTIKISKGKVNLNQILRRVYNQFSAEASDKSIRLGFTAPPDGIDTEIYTDSFKISQVLRNLVGNAFKFTTKGKVEFGYSLKEKKVEFYVSDTGIGIPEEHQPSVFSRFYQVDRTPSRSYTGTGLGLAISKAYVELLGGEIWFTSQPGEGSVFRFTLPDERVGG
jgi:signal transduction histidine kinase